MLKIAFNHNKYNNNIQRNGAMLHYIERCFINSYDTYYYAIHRIYILSNEIVITYLF